MRVEIIVADEVKEPESEPTQSEEYEYTFETFIVGSSNKFAHAAAQAVAANQAAHIIHFYLWKFRAGQNTSSQCNLL